ncbi:uncharacterized protein LOC119373608 [Rhipicephalus sanguineus]|uniref:uncharacterized protein LOC119373608 n=1 Tax=Rhipicephalus sanguineus TaxID=34632 RepID=UPI001896276D|nr:uncharacterized protein LOC119373608 [Rhipicephalus sanguineus]
MWTISIVCLVSLAHETTSVTLEDLKHFLHTHEKIWTRYRSFEVGPKHNYHRCIYAEVRPTEQGHYAYAQHYEFGYRWISQMLVAEVFESRTKHPVLRVKLKNGRTYDYHLVFWSDLERCAVFTISVNGKRRCEVQVWNDHVKYHLPRCQMTYKRYCPGNEFEIYMRHCSPPRHSQLESHMISTK